MTIILADFRHDPIRVACTLCPRRGTYRKASLIARFGADTKLPDVLAALAADCDHFPPMSTIKVCGAYFEDLAKWPPTTS